jgi:hypothetical protein
MAGPTGATARLALPYPVPDDNVDVPRDVKALTDKLDPNITTFVQGTAAMRPPAGVPGRFHYATDNGLLTYDDGTMWRNAQPPVTTGVTNVTWPGGGAVSNEMTESHGFTTAPRAVMLTPNIFDINPGLTALATTTFKFRCAAFADKAAGTYGTVYWLAQF